MNTSIYRDGDCLVLNRTDVIYLNCRDLIELTEVRSSTMSTLGT
jgi:hypothetical protein